MVTESHHIFAEKFCLQSQLMKIIAAHQESLLIDRKPPLHPKGFFTLRFNQSQKEYLASILAVIPVFTKIKVSGACTLFSNDLGRVASLETQPGEVSLPGFLSGVDWSGELVFSHTQEGVILSFE